jgi:hypothetical protein
MTNALNTELSFEHLKTNPARVLATHSERVKRQLFCFVLRVGRCVRGDEMRRSSSGTQSNNYILGAPD